MLSVLGIIAPANNPDGGFLLSIGFIYTRCVCSQ